MPSRLTKEILKTKLRSNSFRKELFRVKVVSWRLSHFLLKIKILLKFLTASKTERKTPPV